MEKIKFLFNVRQILYQHAFIQCPQSLYVNRAIWNCNLLQNTGDLMHAIRYD